ncbi:MAG: 23S rRNA (adenine(2503)-C(2))-methyltransferase RlmN [Lachnospiraceae bacterium]|nr:23S rRNA (adenine(2503)-C(2))-methyltransferase RlmN [Lachnospiraceae bacterium]
MKDIKELYYDELLEEIGLMGEKSFRAGQIYTWMHKKLASSFDEMSDISKSLRDKLKDSFAYTVLKEARKQVSGIDGTVKYLFELPDKNKIETVSMDYHHGHSVCISSQVGCRMGCKFCASTLGGLVRNLSAAEMLEQIYSVSRDRGKRVDNVVVMGIGEPMDNYDELIRFIRILTSDKGLDLSVRSITVSTCGIVPGIYRLSEEGLGITLALSLHAVSDEKRKRIMPVANSYTLAELMEAVDIYFKKTGRRVSFEYSLIRGVNDSEEDAKGLALLAGKRGCHVNLIPVNPVTEAGLKEPVREAVLAFQKKLRDMNVNATIRRELGRDIDGACGQLRRSESNAG